MLSPLTTASFTKMQLNAGAVFSGVDFSTYTDAAAARTALKALIGTSQCFGATQGGGSFESKPETRKIEVDGKRYAFVGDTIVDSVDAVLKFTCKEATANNLKAAMISASATTSGKLTTITQDTEIDSTDYIAKLVWVGDTGEGLMAIELQNALSTNGLTYTFQDKKEGTIPFEFHAHQGSVSDLETAPYKIYLLTD